MWLEVLLLNMTRQGCLVTAYPDNAACAMQRYTYSYFLWPRLARHTITLYALAKKRNPPMRKAPLERQFKEAYSNTKGSLFLRFLTAQ